VTYRDLGPDERPLAKLVQKYAKGRANFTRWSSAWDWVARCAVYDAWVDRQARLANIAAIKDMKARHRQIAMSAEGAGALALNKVIAAERSGTTLTLKPSEIKDLLEFGTKLERLTLGEPGEIERVSVEAAPVVHDYSALSTEELLQLGALTRKARGDA